MGMVNISKVFVEVTTCVIYSYKCQGKDTVSTSSVGTPKGTPPTARTNRPTTRKWAQYGKEKTFVVWAEGRTCPLPAPAPHPCEAQPLMTRAYASRTPGETDSRHR